MVLILVRQTPTFNRSALVLVWRIGLDMVEVGGSNPPGPTSFYSTFFRTVRFGSSRYVDTTQQR